YARADPRVSQTDKERGEISVAGQNSRYNTITIDGVAVNDTFGLEANGSPTTRQPISIEAIQSVQVNVANYDVTQKGYTGANINAVTKSGTNDFHGSLYYVFRNDNLAGDRYDRTSDSYSAPPSFKETTKGFTIGGPIIPDRLFFFGSYEELHSTRGSPEFGPLGSNLVIVPISQSSITGAQAIAANTYGGAPIGGFDLPGGSELLVKDTLFKLDWNITDTQRVSVRYTKTEQTEPIYPNFTSRNLALSSQYYNQAKSIDTVVGQWFADWTPTFSTELKLSRRNYESQPNNNADLPQVLLTFSGALPAGSPAGASTLSRNLYFGTERSRHFNVLSTKTDDLYLGANLTLGDHDLKFGADYSTNEVYNAFLQDTKGNYTFSCVNSSAAYTYSFGAINCGTASAAQVEAAVLENFRIGRPLSYSVQTGQTGFTLDDGVARWTLSSGGLFLQDSWRVSKNLSVMAGARIDQQNTSDRPLANAAAAAAPTVNPATGRAAGGFGLDNTRTLDGENLVQPRLGFNWNLGSDTQRMQLRGGVGLFQGAAASVWLSNPYSNTGIATKIVGCGISGYAACSSAGGVFRPDTANQLTNFAGAASAANVDFISPSLSQPSVWKANLAFESQLPAVTGPLSGLVGSAEWIHTRTKSSIYYQQLNLGAPTRQGSDGRDLFYTPQGYSPNCWDAVGNSITNGVNCTGFRTRAGSNPAFNNVLLATESDKGGGNAITLALNQPLKNGLSWQVAYTRTSATEVSPLTSSTSNSNWSGRSVFNPNEEVSANSTYLVRDRFNANLAFSRAFIGNYSTTFGVFYEGRRGKPYSWTYINDLNGDGLAGNDLMYIPSAAGSGEVAFRNAAGAIEAPNGPAEQAFWAVVNNYSELSNSKGSVVKRNASFAPFTNQFDLRISQEIPGFVTGHKGVLSFDILNVGNLLSKRWGRIEEVAFQSGGGPARSFVYYGGVDAQGRYIYNVGPTEDYVTRQQKGESQWAVQATVKYQF
ncbi:MAG: Oar protein, partial [Pseudomonadota bacterium]|nr:Oar protein [Pseudomonadota bacterium]